MSRLAQEAARLPAVHIRFAMASTEAATSGLLEASVLELAGRRSMSGGGGELPVLHRSSIQDHVRATRDEAAGMQGALAAAALVSLLARTHA